MRYFKIIFTRLFFSAIVIFLSSCDKEFGIDYKIEAVDIINRDRIGEYIDISGRDSYILNWGHGEFILVKISTKFNFVNYISNPGKSISVRGYFCGDKDAKILTVLDLYLDGIPVRRLKNNNMDSQNVNGREFSYLIVICSSLDKIDKTFEAYNEISGYNLIKNPSDICLVIRGGDMVSIYRTKEIVVPYDELTKAIKAYFSEPRL